jgi:hypothetical protein
MNPECRAGKHNNCDGRAIDMDLDEFVNCICACHNTDTAQIRREFTRE